MMNYYLHLHKLLQNTKLSFNNDYVDRFRLNLKQEYTHTGLVNESIKNYDPVRRFILLRTKTCSETKAK